MKERLYYAFEQGLSSSINFVITIVIARIGGKELLGDYLILYGFYFFFFRFHAATVCMPLATSAIEKDEISIIRSNYTLSIILFFIMQLCYPILNQFFLTNPIGIMDCLIISTSSISLLNFEYYRRSLILKKDIIKAIILNFSYLFLLSLQFLYVYNQSILLEVADIYMIFLLSSLPVLNKLFQDKSNLKVFSSITLVCRHLSQQRGLIVNAISQWWNAQAPFFSIAYFIDASSISIVGVVRNLFGPLNILLLSIESYIPKKFSQLIYRNKYIELKNNIISEIIFSTSLMAVVGIAMIGFSERIISIIYGKEFYSADIPLIVGIYIGIYYMSFLSRYMSCALRAFNKSILIGKISFKTIILLTALLVCFVPSYKVFGAMLSILLSEILFLLLSGFYVYELLKNTKDCY